MNNLNILKTLVTDNFARDYALLNKSLVEEGDKVPSRNGMTREFLNFKTEITNPYKRCVGGYKRDINIYFLLIEALWIYIGRRDVKLLSYFNSNMKSFSDDGEFFHAPYGFRMRHHGIHSSDHSYSGDVSEKNDSSKHAFAKDKILEVVKMLEKNPDDRRIAISIWNDELDLATDSKDIPCNDFLMFKIRNNKLHYTIANRSNDLHWGLPTNIFQFTFLAEIIASTLGIELGTATHNSQSLHAYLEHPLNDYKQKIIALDMLNHFDNREKGIDPTLYSNAYPLKMDFKFQFDTAAPRLKEIDTYVKLLIKNLESYIENDTFDVKQIEELKNFSKFLYDVYSLLYIYVRYKKSFTNGKPDNSNRAFAIRLLQDRFGLNCCWDMYVLACNFFASKITDNELRDSLTANNPTIGSL